MTRLTVTVRGRRELRFGDGTPVRSASAVAPFAGGWLVAQDDATAGAWLTHDARSARRLRLLPPVAGHDVFSEAAGTKRSKPDLEAGCEVPLPEGGVGVLLLGSGSLPNRTRAVLVRAPAGVDADPTVAVADLTDLYDQVGVALELAPGQRNLEGACVVGERRLRWFQRGLAAQGVPSSSVDLPLDAVLAAVRGEAPASDVDVTAVRRYDLGTVAGVALDVTDAVTLPDGRVVVSAAAEATADAVADGPVAGSAVALLDVAGEVAAVAPVRSTDVPLKIEGLALVSATPDGAVLFAVVDQDDPTIPSLAIDVELGWT